MNIAGIGSAPIGEESVGECSQMACFVRRDLLDEPSVDTVTATNSTDTNECPFPIEKFNYKLLFENEFPIDEDKRTVEEVIMDNVVHFFNRFTYKFDEEFFYNYERDRYEFPMQQIYECVHEAPDYEQLKNIVMKKYRIEENDIVIVPVPVDDASNSEFDGSDVENDVNDQFK